MTDKKPANNKKKSLQEPGLEEILAAIHRDKAAAAEATDFTADEDFVTNLLRAEFVAQVRTVMKQRQLKPAALARRTNLSPARISKILQEKGNITLGVIARIAVALDAKVSLNFSVTGPVTTQPQRSVAIDQHLLVTHSSYPAADWKKQQEFSTSVNEPAAAPNSRKFTDFPLAQGC